VVRDVVRIDVSAMPELASLAEDVERTRTPRVIERNGEPLALLVPTRRRGRRGVRRTLVDTSALPPIPYRTLDDLIADREAPPTRTFSWDEIKETIDRERAQAWRSKNP
jgi:hypothetical protein